MVSRMGGSILEATGKSADLIAHSFSEYKEKIKALSEIKVTQNYYPSLGNPWKFPF
jgi:hypothetical protein